MGALDEHLFEVLPGVWAAVLMTEESPPDDGPYGLKPSAARTAAIRPAASS